MKRRKAIGAPSSESYSHTVNDRFSKKAAMVVIRLNFEFVWDLDINTRRSPSGISTPI